VKCRRAVQGAEAEHLPAALRCFRAAAAAGGAGAAAEEGRAQLALARLCDDMLQVRAQLLLSNPPNLGFYFDWLIHPAEAGRALLALERLCDDMLLARFNQSFVAGFLRPAGATLQTELSHVNDNRRGFGKPMFVRPAGSRGW